MLTPIDARFYSDLNLKYREEKLKFQPPKFISTPFRSDLLIPKEDQVIKKPDAGDLKRSSDAVRISKNGKNFGLKIGKRKEKEEIAEISCFLVFTDKKIEIKTCRS